MAGRRAAERAMAQRDRVDDDDALFYDASDDLAVSIHIYFWAPDSVLFSDSTMIMLEPWLKGLWSKNARPQLWIGFGPEQANPSATMVRNLESRLDSNLSLFLQWNRYFQAPRGRRRTRRGPLDDEMAERDDEAVPIDILENMRGRSVKDHVSDEAVSREIEYRLKNFLRAFKDKDRVPKYINVFL